LFDLLVNHEVVIKDGVCICPVTPWLGFGVWLAGFWPWFSVCAALDFWLAFWFWLVATAIAVSRSWGDCCFSLVGRLLFLALVAMRFDNNC
jgi:hypothetical protein